MQAEAQRQAEQSRHLQRIPVAERPFPAVLEPLRAQLEASRLEFVSIAAFASQGTKPWKSKFLGLPYLPRDMPYPRDASGKPLPFLAQINFAEMPGIPDYPDRGIVQFFIADAEASGPEGHVWGMNFYRGKPFDEQKHFDLLSRQSYFRVLYHAEVVEDEGRLQPAVPRAAGLLPVTTEARLEFRRTWGHVLPSDYRFKSVFGAEPHAAFARFGPKAGEAGQAYLDYVWEHHAGRVGGYATFTQHDPRSARPNEDWIVLLGIDSGSENGVDILWGDAGVGYFLIRRSDLRARDFSRVVYNWDNH